MTSTTIHLDNSNNSPENNPPGYSVWVGGNTRGDTNHGAVKLNKTDTDVPLTITPEVLVNGTLLTWYYSYGWYSGPSITGPFEDGAHVMVPTDNEIKIGNGPESED
jgi:hypothetical protein